MPQVIYKLSAVGIDLSPNPVNSIIAGPLGTGSAWPSRARTLQ